MFTAFPEPDHRPPRVRLVLDTNDPNVLIRTATITRDGQPIRAEIPAGGSQIIVYDYEMPYDTLLTYRAVGQTVDLNGEVTAWLETWDNTSAWAVVGSWSTSPGEVWTNTATGPTLTRALPAEVSTINVYGPVQGAVDLLDNGNNRIATLYTSVLTSTGTDRWWLYNKNGQVVATGLYTRETSVFQFRIGAGTISMQINGTTTSLPNVDPPAKIVLRPNGLSPSPYRFFTIEVLEAEPVVADYDETATTILEGIEYIWMVHVTHPGLSVPISTDPCAAEVAAVALGTAEETTYAASVADFDIPGRKRRVRNRVGVRSDGVWTMLLDTSTLEQRDEILVMHEDQTPFLLRTPAAIREGINPDNCRLPNDWDLPDGYYGVDDLVVRRPSQPLHRAYREIRLPLVPLDYPEVILQPDWTYGVVATTYNTYQQVLDTNDSYTTLLLGTGDPV